MAKAPQPATHPQPNPGPNIRRGTQWLSREDLQVRDYERLAATVTGFHYLVFAGLMLARFLILTEKVNNRP